MPVVMSPAAWLSLLGTFVLLAAVGCVRTSAASTPIARAGGIEGAVLVADSQDHSGTVVKLVVAEHSASGVPHGTAVITVETAPDGSFRIFPVLFGAYYLVYERDGYPPVSTGAFKLDQPLIRMQTAYLVKTAAGITTIIGRVRLWGQAEHGGANVTATAWGHTGNAVTGPDGSFALTNIPAGFYYNVAFGADGFARTDRQLLVREDEFLELPEVWLFRNGSVTGRVLMADRRPPAAAVSVLSDGQGREFRVATDTDGRYEFTAVAPGRYWLGAVLAESVRMAPPYIGPCVDVVVYPGEETVLPEIVIGDEACRELQG